MIREIKKAEFYCVQAFDYGFPPEVSSLVNSNEDVLVIHYYTDNKELAKVEAGICDSDGFGGEIITNLRELTLTQPIPTTEELTEFLKLAN
jgi:hypothetical protein